MDLNTTNALTCEEVVKLLSEPDTRSTEQGLLASLDPVRFDIRTIIDLNLENKTIYRHADFSGFIFKGDCCFRGTVFLAGANFTRAIFEGLAEFDTAIFRGPVSLGNVDTAFLDFPPSGMLPRLAMANFERARFLSGATFVGTSFQVRANFKYATFIGPAYFWRTFFEKNAYFSHLEVDATPPGKERHSKHANRHVAEANFSYAVFTGSADFSRARFHGHTFFHRTVFLGNSVKFETVRFDDEVIFEGNRGDVCISRSDLDTTVQRHLFDRHVLCGNNDNEEGYLNFEMHFNGEGEIDAYLANNSTLRADQREAVVNVWNSNSKPMFACEKQGVNFRGLFINGKSEPPQFNNVDLSNCAFAGTNVGRIRFTDVKWPEKNIFFRFSRRKAVFDELLLHGSSGEVDSKSTSRRRYLSKLNPPTRPNRYSAIATLYQQLRRGYASDGLMSEARDFYFGELQMNRFASGSLRRWVSLSFIYRILSGYGRQEGVAFSWLIFFLFILFPTMYALLNPSFYDHWWAWPMSHSLRVATFLRDVGSSPNQASEPRVSQVTALIEGVERVVVSIQAGLFVIAAKWRFDPGRYETMR